MRAAKRREQMCRANRPALSPRGVENLGFLDMPADPEHHNSRQQSDAEQHAPGYGFGQKGIERRIDERCATPTDRPAGLHETDAAAAVFVADDFAHQHGAGGPFAAKAEPVQRAQHEQLLEILRKGAQKREERIPEDRDLQHADATETVGERAAKPAAQRRDQQGDGADEPGLALRQPPERDNGRDHKTVHLDVERIERPAAKAGAHGAPFARGQILHPGEHAVLPTACFATDIYAGVGATELVGNLRSFRGGR